MTPYINKSGVFFKSMAVDQYLTDMYEVLSSFMLCGVHFLYIDCFLVNFDGFCSFLVGQSANNIHGHI